MKRKPRNERDYNKEYPIVTVRLTLEEYEGLVELVKLVKIPRNKVLRSLIKQATVEQIAKGVML